MPSLARAAGAEPRDVGAVEQHAARAGRQLARDQVEVGGLAGAVGADDRRQRAGVEGRADVIDRDVAAEADGEVARLQDGIGPCRPPAVIPAGARQRGRAGTQSDLRVDARWPWVPDTRCASSGMTARLLLVADRQRHVLGGDGRHQLQHVVVLGVLLDAEVIHVLQRLVVLLAEGHRRPWACRSVMPSMAAISFSVSVEPAFCSARDHRRCRREAAGDEEVRRRVVALLVLGLQPVVHRVLREVVVVVDAAFGAGELLPAVHDGQDVAAGRQLDAEAIGLHVDELGHRVRRRPR